MKNTPTLDCRVCRGDGELTTGQASDGMLHTRPCPADCDDGQMANPDFDPAFDIHWNPIKEAA